MKKIIAFVLALLLAVSCLGMSAFAENTNKVRQYGKVDETGYGGYLAIGDSIARGMGVPDFAEKGFDSVFYDWDCRNVPGSYPYIIAQEAGCSMPDDINDQSGNFWPCCYPGFSLIDVNDMLGLDDGYYDDEFRCGRYGVALQHFGDVNSIDGTGTTGSVGSLRDLCEKASLITIGLGMGDVLFRAKEMAFEEDEPLEMADVMEKEMLEGYARWVKCYPVLIDYLQQVNPKATIVLVGAVNFTLNLTLTDDSLLPLFDVCSVIFASMNAYTRQLAAQKGCLYADISNTEVASTQYEWSLTGNWADNTNLSTHPTPEGNAYMARQILAQLPTESESESDLRKTDIVVDLARFEKVNYVMLDDKTVTDYSMDGYDLIIKNNSTNCKTLTVCAADADGKLTFLVYQLTYHDGYTAYRIYGVSAAKLITVAKSRVNTVKNLVSGLFTKN